MKETNGKDPQNYHAYPRYKILVYKSIAYYKKYGLWRTIWIAWVKLKGIWKAKKKMRLYSSQATASQTTQTYRLRKVSFLVGMVEGGPRRYRVDNIVEGLQNRGITSCVFYEADYRKMETVLDADLAIIFRARMSPRVDAVLNRLEKARVHTVFDIDDLVFDPRYVNCLDEARDLPKILKDSFTNDFIKYRQVLERCPFATCTTETIAEVIRQGGKKSFVIPNTINRTQLELAATLLETPRTREAGKLWIGYFSGTNTHNRDFLEAAGAIMEILKKYPNIEFHIIGPLQLPADFRQFGCRIIRKSLMSYLDMLKYLSKMDVNIAPLEQNNIFTDGKSELKIFEAGLVEVPTVASRTASYSQCISDGRNGFLAGTGEEWQKKLSLLVENAGLRKEMSKAARQDFIARFYIDNAIDGIIKIYEEIAASR